MSKRRSEPSVDSWRQHIVQYIQTHPDRPLKTRALARQLGVPNEQYTDFRHLVRQMLDEGLLCYGPGRTLAIPDAKRQIVGVFRANRRGFGFIECPGKPDLFVPRGKTRGAHDGDTVMARLLRRGGPGGLPRAEVVRIVKRAPIRWVGVLERSERHWFVQPQSKTPTPRVLIENPRDFGSAPGDLVVVMPDEATLGKRVVHGRIIERLGRHDDARAIVRGVIKRYDLPEAFPPQVLRAAERAADRYDPSKLTDREDLRRELIITIDPVDARDFDDAISLRDLGDGRIELGVHIADVSFFVRPDEPLDREAKKRGNSVYFPGRVVPMLPEVLSNGVCSLQPNEDRLARSVFITYDGKANVVATRFCKSIIRSSARLTYEQASAVLDGQDVGLPKRVVQLLKRAEDLARRIRRRRIRNGMISLVIPEVELRLNDDGQIVDAGPADTSFSHTIIEMFMVEANEAVSRALTEAGITHLRRVHPRPEPDAGEALATLMARLGLPADDPLDRHTMQKLLNHVRGRPEEPVVNYLLLRCLPQAYYSPERIGHFALASEDYCHFTSPIRRYPDLVNHRLLDVLTRGRRRKRTGYSDDELAELGQQTSHTERLAIDAERDAKQLLLLELMRHRVGETLDGVVSGIASFGIFVQVQPYLAEGLIDIADLGREPWIFDRTAAEMVGRRTGRVVRLGQPIKVVVAAVNPERHELVLVPAEPERVGQPPAKAASQAAPAGRTRKTRSARRGRRGSVKARKRRR